MTYLTRGFMLSLIFSFTLLVGVLYVSANQAYMYGSAEDAEQTREWLETQRQTITMQDIFINNFMISIPMILPAIGLVPFYIAWQNTGQAVGLLSLAYNIHPSIYIGNLIVLGFTEILAYTFLSAENIYVTALAILKQGAKERITQQSWKTLIIYLILLFISAATETVGA